MKKQKRIDNRLESYVTFFDFAWAKAICQISAKTVVDEIVFELCSAWKVAANTHRLPWLMVSSLKSFQSAFIKRDDPTAMKVIQSLLTGCKLELGDSISEDALEKLQRYLRRMLIQFGAQKQQLSERFDSQAVWKDYLEATEFQISLWGSQRIVYGAVYYAYEFFLYRAYMLKTKCQRYRIKDYRSFKNDFTSAFTPGVCDDCWSDRRIQNARLIRNALVHNGGRETGELKNEAHGLPVYDGELQIGASDTTALFNLLKTPALKLAGELVK